MICWQIHLGHDIGDVAALKIYRSHGQGVVLKTRLYYKK